MQTKQITNYCSQTVQKRGNRKEETGEKRLRTEDREQRTEPAPLSVVPSSVLRPPSSASGDCIACNRCVHVCPTGIDIRHGLQLECIGCAACIDACDEVMVRVKRPTGLIRYDSLAGFAGGATRWVRPRTIVYGILLLVGAAVATFAFSTVKPANFSVVRLGGAAYFVERDTVRNQFMVRVLNKRTTPAAFTVSVEHLARGVAVAGADAPLAVDPMGEQVHPLVLTASRAHYPGPFHFKVRVRDSTGRFDASREVEFLGPEAKLLEEEDHEKGIKR